MLQGRNENRAIAARIARCCTALLSWTVLACSSAELPADGIETPYVQALAGYLDPDDARGASDGYGVALAFGWRLSPRMLLEIEGAHFNLETYSQAVTDFYRLSLGTNVLFTLRRSGWTPYVLAGAGVADNDVFPDSEDSTDPYVQGGLGFMTRSLGSYGLRVRADARYLHDFFADDTDDLVFHLGLVVPLRKPRTIEVVRTETREVLVERPVPAPPPPAPPPAPTPPAKPVIIELRGVEFETGSAQLTPASLTVLQTTAISLREQSTMRVEVAGHTDSVGRDDANLDLSRRRAQSVADYLVTTGIARERLQSAGYGESQPIATNDTPEGRARNRRVELRVLSR